MNTQLDDHLDEAARLRFLRGAMRGGEVADVLHHLDSCRECAAASVVDRQAVASADAFLDRFDLEVDDHPDVETLTRYVDGELAAGGLRAIETHLHDCPRCGEDVADLRATAAALRQSPRRRWPLWLAAASLAAMAIIATLMLSRPPRVVPHEQPAPPIAEPRQYLRDEWQNTVADTLRRGAIAMPAALSELRLPADPERSPGGEATSHLAPAGVIVESPRPQFAWTGAKSARYTVSVFEDGRVIAESPLLREPHWQPARDLPRGVMLQWQVEVRRGDDRSILPAPPAPPAFLRVLDAKAHEDLDAARAAHGADPLILGVLYARYGLRAEAERELAQAKGADAERLLRSVQAWPQGTP